MPSLDWLGKRAVVNHHTEVPYRLLHCDADLSAGDPEIGNLLVQGDNLEALKALLPYYAGRIKCIYIDPPYNTGNEGWVYNDNVSSPEIKAWLGRVTGREDEDLSRHDKWLCMMYPRLRLLREFLAPDGFILVSIDDVELARLRLLMDEIFTPGAFVSCFVWKSRKFLDSRSTTNVSNDHEYVLAYRGGETARFRGLERDETKFSNPDDDPRGPWMSRSILGLANAAQRPNLHYQLVDPATGGIFDPPADTGWRYGRARMDELVAEGSIIFPKKAGGRPREKKYKADLLRQFMAVPSVISDVHTSDGTDEIRAIFGNQAFDFPKPSAFVARFIEQAADGPCMVLDAFAGSGTTGHAALQLASAGTDVRFILVEIDEHIASTITRERLKRVIDGYDRTTKNGETERVNGLGGGFRYCRLGAPLFDPDGGIGAQVTFRDLAAHVFFSETGLPIPAAADGGDAWIGRHEGLDVYLMHPTRLGDDGMLTSARLRELSIGTDPSLQAVIYADGCSVPDERLRTAGVTFKQIPYQIEGL